MNLLYVDLEDEDPVQGEAYINRAAQLQTQTKDSRLQILYKVKNMTFITYLWEKVKIKDLIFFWMLISCLLDSKTVQLNKRLALLILSGL